MDLHDVQNAGHVGEVSAEEAAMLVKSLYEPRNTPENIRTTQAHLHVLQRSRQGWRLANTFLSDRDRNVRFFGALTFSLKLHNDWNQIVDDEVQQIFERLIEGFVRAVLLGDGSLVVKKLCVALSAYFFQPSVAWEDCIIDIAQRLHQQHAEGQGAVSLPPDNQKQALFWFATILAEDGTRLDSSTKEGCRQIQKLNKEVRHVVNLLRGSWEWGESDQTILVALESLQCLKAWCLYIALAAADSSEAELLKDLIPHIIQLLAKPDDAADAAEFLSDILDRSPAFIRKKDLQSISASLTSPYFRAILDAMRDGSYDEISSNLLNLLLIHADVIVHEIAHGVGDMVQRLSQALYDLLYCNGTPGVGDHISPMVLPFWTTYIEFLQDVKFDDVGNDSVTTTFGPAYKRVYEVVEACWQRIQWPCTTQTNEWDSEELEAFKSFRVDVQDLFQASHMLIGHDIFALFLGLSVRAYDESHWPRLEASIYGLSALSESSAAANQEISPMLSMLFRSPILGMLEGCDAQLRNQIQRGLLRLIMSYSSFLKCDIDNLPRIVRFVCSFLTTSSTALLAAKCLSTLADSCRNLLFTEINTILHPCLLILQAPECDTDVAQRLIGAMGRIILAIEPKTSQLEVLHSLLNAIADKVRYGFWLMDSVPYGQGEYAANCGLRCLAALSSSMQTPDIIDLECDRSEDNLDAAFWHDGQGSQISSMILQLVVEGRRRLSHSPDAVEALCRILRAGSAVDHDSPFNFPTTVHVEFLLSTNLATAKLDYVFETIGAELARGPQCPDAEEDQGAVYASLNHGRQLLKSQSDMGQIDPEFGTSVLDVMRRTIPRHLKAILSVPREEFDLLEYALAAISAPEANLKGAAASFWASIAQSHDAKPQREIQIETIQAFGARLIAALVNQIGGLAMRSQLEILCVPLKALIKNHHQAVKSWIETALLDPSFPSPLVTRDDKRIWLKKLLSLRGARNSNVIVKNFWVQCMGKELSYA